MHYEKFADGTIKCIENEIPFELPKGWEWCRLINVSTEIIAGGDKPEIYSKDKTETNIIPIYSNGVENRGLYGYTNGARILEPSITISARGTIGFCCLRNEPFVPIIRLISITPILMNIIYLKSVFQVLIEKSEGSSIPQLTVPAIKPKLIPIPPIKEQNRITLKINELLSFVDTIESAKADFQSTIQLIKSKILDLAIRGKLVPQDPNDEPATVLLERIRAEKEKLIEQGKIKRDKKESFIFKGEDNSYYEKIGDSVTCIDDELPFEIPNGWIWCNLSMIGQTNIGLTYSPADIDPNGIMVLRSSNIINSQLDFSDLVKVNTNIRDSQYVENNDILICARNGSKALVGKCALIENFNEKASFGAFMAIYRTAFYRYIFYFLQTSVFKEIFYDGNSTAINQLTQAMIKSARIPLPPIEEQNRITMCLKECYKAIDQIEKSLS